IKNVAEQAVLVSTGVRCQSVEILTFARLDSGGGHEGLGAEMIEDTGLRGAEGARMLGSIY
ncbi:hypothetical protein RZS08_55700, partial [Arthrospira platensis SPKY1]|nr:hypothetical protein [Arthrospira platensis SPKY1]